MKVFKQIALIKCVEIALVISYLFFNGAMAKWQKYLLLRICEAKAFFIVNYAPFLFIFVFIILEFFILPRILRKNAKNLSGKRSCSVVVVAIAAVFTTILCCRNHQVLPPQVRQSPLPAAIAVKPVAPRSAPVMEPDPASISSAIAAACGADPATAGRYEARSDALLSILRERRLPANAVAALAAWLASTDDPLRAERLAALKNDAMNLLRRQDPPPPDFADTLISMFESEAHPPAVLDYCVQHLGAMQGDIPDESKRLRIRSLLAKAAKRTRQPYAGTALYALAGDASATPAQEAELRRLTLALCAPSANPAARIAAVQLAGERGYSAALPLLRDTLSADRRDAVTDIACLGSLGLLGTAEDIPLLRRFAALGPRYAPAAETAIKRIEARGGGDGEQR